MSGGVCAAFDLPVLPGSVSHDEVDAHLDMAREILGDDLVAALALVEPETGGAGALVASRRREPLESVRNRSPMRDACWSAVGGLAEDAMRHSASSNVVQDAYMTVVVDQSDPPIPFDDPAVLGVFRDQLAWYMPLLGHRHLACGALFFDGVRALGSYTVFSSESLEVAQYLSVLDPWRRVGPGWLFTVPRDAFTQHPAPPGPGTQRSAAPVCAGVDSIAEPSLPDRGGS